jgi:hypothetical protein
MKTARQAIIGFFDTLSGRLGILLALGLVVASLLSLTLAEHARRYDFAHVRLERVVDSVDDMYDRFTSDPQRTQALLLANKILGARDAPPGWATIKPDPSLTGLLAKRLGTGGLLSQFRPRQQGCWCHRYHSARVLVRNLSRWKWHREKGCSRPHAFQGAAEFHL